MPPCSTKRSAIVKVVRVSSCKHFHIWLCALSGICLGLFLTIYDECAFSSIKCWYAVARCVMGMTHILKHAWYTLSLFVNFDVIGVKQNSNELVHSFYKKKVYKNIEAENAKKLRIN